MGIILPVTLTAAAAAAIINLWLAIRVGQMRGATKPRMIGTLVTMLTLLGLAIVAVLIVLGVM